MSWKNKGEDLISLEDSPGQDEGTSLLSSPQKKSGEFAPPPLRKAEISDANDDHEDVFVDAEQKESLEHVVKSGETLRSIAAFYDTTPSHLAQANRCSTSRLVFPGDKLLIPPRAPDPPPLPPPKKVERHSVIEEEDIVERQFVKLNVRHITDGSGIVCGSLLITPKTFMFNPNQTDLLVMENETDSYQIICPAEYVVSLAIFNDFGKFNSTFGIACKESNKNLLYVPQEDDVEQLEDESDPQGKESKPMQREFSREENPAYLRLVMGKPIAKKLPRSAPIVSYGQQNLEPEYWFIVRQDRAKHLHHFANYLFPKKYGLLDHMSIERSGYEVIRPGVKLLEEEAGHSCNRESVSKMIKKNLTMTSVDFDLISDMIGTSEIIRDEERETIARELPPRTDGHNWELVYSTSEHGFNLNSVYRKMSEKYDGPILIIIEDVNSYAFGVYLTEPPHLSEHFFGTGETFVFQLRPQFKAFHWTGENEYFSKGETQSFVVGSGNGKFSLWLDGDLNLCRSEACVTFDNEPLASGEDFTLKTLECWAFTL